MGDFPDFSDEGRRRRNRKRRYTDDFGDDAWGMADDADHYDGPTADLEDWASGLVDEEGRRESIYHHHPEDDPGGNTESIPYRSRYSIQRFYARHRANPTSPPLTSRSDRFRERMGRDVIQSYEPRGRRSRQINAGSAPAAPRFWYDLDALSPTAVIALAMLVVLVCSCALLVLYFLFG
jgi:hypothetical protein